MTEKTEREPVLQPEEVQTRQEEGNGDQGEENVEPPRNKRGQLIVSYDDWTDISRVGTSIHRGRYEGYLCLKRYAPSLQRVEFSDHPDSAGGLKIDLAALRAEAETAVMNVEVKRQGVRNARAAEQKRKAERRKDLPQRQRAVSIAQQTIRDARRLINDIRRKVPQMIADKRAELLRKCADDADAATTHAQREEEALRGRCQVQFAEISEYQKQEKGVIEETRLQTIDDLNSQVHIDVGKYQAEVEEEYNPQLRSLQIALEEAQKTIARGGAVS